MLIRRGIALPPGAARYTVPAIHHLSSDKYIMDSAQILRFIDDTYPDSKALAPNNSIAQRVMTEGRFMLAKLFSASLTPRETRILSPRAADYFRTTREANMDGKPLESLLEEEESSWSSLDAQLRSLGADIEARETKGPFLTGETPSIVDITLAAAMHNAKMVHEPTFTRLCSYPGFEQIYAACIPFSTMK